MKTKLFLVSLLISSYANAQTPALECPNFRFPNGVYSGRLTTALNHDGWRYQSYILRTTSGQEGCVEINSSLTDRYRLMRDAFILGSNVTIRINSNGAAALVVQP